MFTGLDSLLTAEFGADEPGGALLVMKGDSTIYGNEFGVRFIYHTGDQGGFRAFYFSIPEKDILYVGLFNRPPRNLNNIIFKGLTLLKENNWLE